MLYTLMNKKERILEFEYNLGYGAFLGAKKIYSLKYAPISLVNCQSNELNKELLKWLNNRKIPSSRDDIRYLLDNLKKLNTMTCMMESYGLSLSDQYWFLPTTQKISWESINYFNHPYEASHFFEASFGKQYSQLLIFDEILDNKNNLSPNMSTNGQLGKCWVQQNGQNYLVKGANTMYRFEAVCEYIASKVCEIFDVPYVKYRTMVLKGQKKSTIVSICPTMIKKNEEFIPAYQVLSEKRDLIMNSSDDYYLYLKILEEHQVPKAREYLQKMIMIDFILCNEDRHLGNFGVIRNVDTLKWISICPIFDTGRSLNTNVSKEYWLDKNAEMKFFTNQFINDNVVSSFFCLPIDKQIIDRLFDIIEIFGSELQKYKTYLNLEDEDIVMLKRAFYQRISYYKDIMLSKNLLL